MSFDREKATKKAKEMLLDGETLDEIKDNTRLRQKDVRRIQKEITKHF
ncbi:hypothetical protein P8V03_01885 [Clostridium sp. A1-XYC3]|uniref:Uncharacterized protein n=1 Tax=Clostridium tanneri TaxID=3037988 RepID=A0ABU4JP24_9CLOT|nr:hypothetical protein [Clostridium sp. A1-XYC3]MDW8799901.1 hypothetical protein [Clostridium sp. A1-XYC3]